MLGSKAYTPIPTALMGTLSGTTRQDGYGYAVGTSGGELIGARGDTRGVH